MNRRYSIIIIFVATALANLSAVMPAIADDSDTTGRLASEQAERLFALEVLPLLKTKCFACHGEDPEGDIKGELDVRSLAGLLRGGESGEASIVPGKPEQSPFYSAIKWEDYEMPPKENDRLTPAQIELVRQWIVAGAPWPDVEAIAKYRKEQWGELRTKDGVIVSTSGGLADEWTYRRYQPEDIWAFQPVHKPQFPAQSIDTNESEANPIDRFIDARREAAGFDPAAQADPLTLIRRATFDLIGLPPTPSEIEQFLAAWQRNREQAWSELIDRLLDSPRYGERWGQHWLDVVRYADTGGYSNDYERSNAWRYRDYVIRSFNEDKPYDQFIMGRRLDLAKWIADPRNPLTTRSIVNRVWQHHFVNGIARNPNNFGTKGAKPTHPELFDWLAADFVDQGWKFKHLHRLIMTSRAYRQSAHHAQMDALRKNDPDNLLIAYHNPRRLTAEELRDSLLAVTGELHTTIGGLPVMPEINMEVALQPRMIQFSIAPAYQPSPTPQQRNRRTIYAYRVRGQADPFLELFNQPNPNDSCEFRDVASVTPQVFALLNSDIITDRSLALAVRLQAHSDELAEQIEQAFQLGLGRAASAKERER